MIRAPRILAFLLLAAPPLAAQRSARLEISLPVPGQAPLVRSLGVLADGQMRDLLRNGFPAQLHYRVELWSESGFFNEMERAVEWDVIVQYDALSQQYRVARLDETPVSLGSHANFADMSLVLATPFRVPLRPPRKAGRYYYAATLDVETLSVSDLDEVERWLRGELKPAVRGKRNPGTAVTRGLRTLFLRLLGGQQRRYEVRSRVFRV